jgi:hypothetical protein
MNYRALFGSVWLIGLLLSGISLAQSEGKFPLRVMSLSEGELPEVFVKSGGEYVLLEFSAIQPSSSVQTSFENPLPIYQRTASGNSKEAFTICNKINLPQSGKGILLLRWSAAEKSNFLAVADDFSGSTNTDWMLINTTGKPLAMQVGKESKFVKIPGSGAMPYKVTAEVNQGAAVVVAEPMEGERWKTFYSTYWPIYPDRRCIVLFVNAGNKIKVKTISDIKQVPQMEASN